MRWRVEPKEPVNKAEWHAWFAWRPVRIGSHMYWLETVRRKGKFSDDSCGGSWSFEYCEELCHP